MSARNIQDFFITDFYGGLNLVDSPNSLQPNQCLLLQNHVFGNGNMTEVRRGFTTELTLSGLDGISADGVDGLYRYNDTTNFFNVCTYRGYFIDDDGGTLNQRGLTSALSASFLTSGEDSNWEYYNTVLYHQNGSDSQLAYRRTAWKHGGRLRNTGVPLPTATTATIATGSASAGTATGDLPAGAYQLLWTLELDDTVIVEGNSNATASSITAGASNYITVSITNPDSTGLNKTLNLYATDTDGEVFYWLTSMACATGANTFTWRNYTDLGISEDNELEYDNYRPPIGTCQRIFNNHMFIGGTSGQPTYLYISKFGRFEQFPANIESSREGGNPVASDYVIDLEDKFVGMEPCGNSGLLVFCENSIHLITGYSVENFAKAIISRNVGCWAKKSIAISPEGWVFWLGQDHVYCYTGQMVVNIGRYVWNEFDHLTSTDRNDITGYFYDHQYCLSYPSSTGLGYPNREMRWDTRHMFTDPQSGNQCPAATGPHVGMSVNCLCVSRLEGPQVAYFGAGDISKLYRYDYGSLDDTASIVSSFHGAIIYPMGAMAQVRFITALCEIKPTATRPSFVLEFDGGKVIEPFQLVTQGTGSTWLADDPTITALTTTSLWLAEDGTTPVWDADVYENLRYRLNQSAQGYCVQIKVTNTNTADRNFAFRNIGFSFSPIRRNRG